MISISIIIPVYNTEKYIEETVKSVLNQTLLPNEIILINDGSTDNSLLILKKLEKENKILKIIDQKNAGPSATRNIGVELAKSDWVSFVDSDDILHPERLEIASFFSENVDAVICEYFRFTENERLIFPTYEISTIERLDILESNKSVIKYGYGLPRMLMKRDSYIKAGGLNVELVNNEDHEFHFRMVSKQMNFRKIKVPLYYYRQHDSKYRLSNQNNRGYYTYKALYKMYNSIDQLPQSLQIFAKQQISDRIANNALKNILRKPNEESIKQIKFAQGLNKHLKPYDNKIFNMISKLFGIGNLERSIGKFKQIFWKKK